MSRGINKVIVVGNLGRDPETQYLSSGTCLTNFSVAVTEVWKDKQTGENQERTEWIDIEVWGKMAEACSEYLRKGSQCYVEGKFKTDSWEDRETGVKKYRTKVRADVVQFLGGRGSRNERASDRQDQDGMPPQSRAQQEEFDDDIPF